LFLLTDVRGILIVVAVGNKYGEPVVAGFARAFGQRLPNGERVEWIKPIMFTAGAGWLDGRHTKKGKCAKQKLMKAHTQEKT
jgi:hypothetical protein